MIQIDMPMPKNCRMCHACSEYDICLIPIDGKGFGEQNVSEFIDSRPDWCPLKEQEVVEPIPYHRSDGTTFKYECRECRTKIFKMDLFCRHCGRPVKWNEDISNMETKRTINILR